MLKYILSLAAASTMSLAIGADSPVVVIETSLGSIEVELHHKEAPISVENFLSYVDDKFYDGTVFHRVIATFMIQGGGFTADLKEKKTKAAIKNEASNGLLNSMGTIAMARRPDPDSATSQFYINVADNAPLDGQYTVFGKVTKGMDVVGKIEAVQTTTQEAEAEGGKMPMADVPKDAVTIISIKRKP